MWRVLAHDLRYLTLCDRDAATGFVQDLLVRYPDVRDTPTAPG